MKYLKHFESFAINNNMISGDRVWLIASNAGSEHNDGLQYHEKQIKSKNYYLLSIPIFKILEEDPNIKHMIEFEISPYKINGGEYSFKREIKQPIIIGCVDNGIGGNYENGVIDGSNRVAQATVNGQSEIMAYVPTDSSFVK